MENVESGDEAASEEVIALQDAMADLLSAEAAVRSAQDDWVEAAKEKAKLEIELEGLRARKGRLPYTFEEIEEVYRMLQSDERLVWVLLARAALALALVSLLLRWRTEGAGSVAGCLLMPLACAMGQV